MSTKALSWGIDQVTGSTTTKCILMLLCDLADEQFTCYPGREYLSEKAEMSESTVSRAVSKLVTDGYIRVLRRARKRGGRTSNRYLILVYGDDTPMPDVDDWVSEFDPVADETAGQSNSAADAPLPVDDGETAGHGNSGAAAPLPAEGNSAAAAHSNVAQQHVSNKEGIYPLAVNKDPFTPPPSATHGRGGTRSAAAAEIESEIGAGPLLDAARKVLREVTAGVEAVRLPTDVERGRLVARVVDLLGDGWSAGRLVARLHGMGPLTTVASVYAVLTARLRDVGEPPPPAPHERLQLAWCRDDGCDPVARIRLDGQGRPEYEMVEGGYRPRWCPACSGR